MRIHRHRKRGPKNDNEINYRTNEDINVNKVRVIDNEGDMLGVMSTDKALEIARERGFDLVEVSPKAKPPVCKLLDYGQFKYRKQKELRKQKAQSEKVEIKGVRLSLNIGEHDLKVRLGQAEKFLKKGNKAKIELVLRGREKAHKDRAREVIKDFIDRLSENFDIRVEQDIDYQSGRMTAIVGRE